MGAYKKKLDKMLRAKRKKVILALVVVFVALILVFFLYYFEFYRAGGVSEQVSGVVKSYRDVGTKWSPGPSKGYLYIQLDSGQIIALYLPEYEVPKKGTRVIINRKKSPIFRISSYSLVDTAK